MSVLVALVCLSLLTGGAFTALQAGRAAAGRCLDPIAVPIAASPEVAPAVRRAAEAVDGKVLDGRCIDVTVDSASAPDVIDTVRAGTGRQPVLWVPDSSIWRGQLTNSYITTAGTFATSPLVAATTTDAATTLGWKSRPVAVQTLLSGPRPLILPDPATSGAGLVGLLTLRSVHGPQPIPPGLAATYLSVARDTAPSLASALERVRAGGANAPLVLTSEQSVWAATATQRDLTAVYTAGRVFELDYPILRVPPRGQSAAQKEASAVVAAALLAPKSQRVAERFGFRRPDGTPSPVFEGSRGVRASAVQRAQVPSPALALDLLRFWSAVTQPSRSLAVIDLSRSMLAGASGASRIELATAAASRALETYPDSAQLGLWGFAARVSGARDYLPLEPIRPLTAPVRGTTQRAAIRTALEALPGKTRRGGTGLYDTALAAVREVRRGHDPDAVNAVVLMTDGRNDDDSSITLPQLLSTLQAEHDPQAPVVIVAIGIGPDVDMSALDKITGATGGSAYVARDPADIDEVLTDALTRRACRPTC